MPLQATSGAASYDAFGGGVPVTPVYIEDVMSVWLYTGTGAAQTINNGIDLAGKGGLVWTKIRSATSDGHALFDTVRGGGNYLLTNTADSQQSLSNYMTFNSDGYSLASGGYGITNVNTSTYVSWTFREAPKFFDVVTYTGNDFFSRAIPHALGSTPGFVIVKRTNGSSDWKVWHRSVAPNVGILNSTIAFSENDGTGQPLGNGYISATSDTTFTVRGDGSGSGSAVNESGGTYVAYLFAHNAGGFGLTGTDNVISCGSYTGNSSTNSINLGFEPQWLMVKRSNSTGFWHMFDVMRGMPVQGNNMGLTANTSNAEGEAYKLNPTATGFEIRGETSGEINANGNTYIYIAIRRGPMKVPESGTSVFAPVAQNSAGTVTTNFPVDLMIGAPRASLHDTNAIDRLRGSSTTSFAQLRTNRDSAEATGSGNGIGLANNTGYVDNFYSAGSAIAYWNFRRAPGFFDEVCYTGDGTVSRNQVHNLGVKPELTIVKKRSGTGPWGVVCIIPGSTSQVVLNSTAESPTLIFGVCFGISATLFVVGDEGLGVADVNQTGQTYVAYFFASCPGVSKVGSYTGTGTTQTINCGFTGGARFVLIKKTSGTGSWYVWDSARGIVSGNDPYLLLNSTAAEVTSTDYVDTYSAGFEISSTAPSEINENGGSFIFFAVA